MQVQRAFLEVIVDDASIDPPLSGICAGFESGQWRNRQLAKRLFDDVIDFALSYSERQEFNSDTGMLMVGRAMRKIYTSEKYARRGEFGELLLHMALREVFKTETALSKIYFKDGGNETVKGFDAVHIVDNGTGLELWLGEVKFYNRLSSAIRDVVAELHDHIDSDYLRGEFLAVEGKIDRSWKHAPKLLSMIHEDVSLDEIFESITIPVLLTYDSPAVAARVAELSGDPEGSSATREAYRAAFEKEVRKGWGSFVAAGLPRKVRIRLILVPLHLKKDLVDALHERLKLWQEATA
ncbi:HamA C-terminal domain-containing protein [Streptomyces mirabilis]|uniref:HamA C-terminal domain-containing protein n=1 Tax=Streptomyces mirabilis TaxID=68239 RepID=UPI0035D9405B